MAAIHGIAQEDFILFQSQVPLNNRHDIFVHMY